MTDLTLDGLVLPPDLLWTDEYDWTPTEQSQSYALSGALVVETAEKLSGRPITLSGDADHGWATREQIDALYAKLTITAPITLVLPDARTFSVRFRNADKPIEAKPIVDYRIMEEDDVYSLIIRLIQV
jgi:hypothetical protein